MPTTLEEKKRALQDKLQKAIELEWATLPPYLTAFYSLRPEKNNEAAALIKTVFMEEMLHMVLAANILAATGGGACIGPANCPVYPLRLEFKGKQFADRQFDIHLAPFSPESIETFLQIELPEEPQGVRALSDRLVIEGSTIGEFYRSLKDDLLALCDEAGAAFVFSGKPEHQVPEHAYWSAGGRIIHVKNLRTAFEALDIIIEQGEGKTGTINTRGPDYFRNPTDVAHYFRFNEIKHKRHYRADDQPDAPPSGAEFAVDYGAVHPIKTDCRPSDFEGDSQLIELNDRFNRTYTLMLGELEAAFNGNPEVLFSATMDGMHGLRDIALAMMQIPLPRDPQRHAAPTFQWTLPLGALPSAAVHSESRPSSPSPGGPMSPSNAIMLNLPLKLTISFDGSAAVVDGNTGFSPLAIAAEPENREALDEASIGLAALRDNAERPYYDAAEDSADIEDYYAEINWYTSAAELYRQLSAKLRDTHTGQPSYKPSVELYPWVDLQPDRTIRSIYSGRSSSPETFIRHDDQVDALRQSRLNQHLAASGREFGPLAGLMAQLESSMPYNCEHSVPQSWFDRRNPMRGDLHHLFACEVRCNSDRGNQPYYEHPSAPGGSNDCGLSGTEGFEPRGGKGAVARSTLYFLLRYPSEIGNATRELHPNRLQTLLQWHRENAPGEYEKHRNQAIFQRQGNRNPLIDFPEMAERIGFEAGFGQARRPGIGGLFLSERSSPPSLLDVAFWSVSRHELIADAASTFLKQPARQAIAAITEPLGANADLRDLAGWADKVKGRMPSPNADSLFGPGSREFLTKFPGDASRDWHFVNLPLAIGTYAAAQEAGFTRQDDVVQMLRKTIEVLQGESTLMSKLNALRWVVHLTGDVHQPVHVGCGFIKPGNPPKIIVDPAAITEDGLAHDRGGNNIILPLNGKPNLHTYWDSTLAGEIDEQGGGPAALASGPDHPTRKLVVLMERTAAPAAAADAIPVSQLPAMWAEESLAAAREAYSTLKIVSKSGSKYRVSWEGKPAYDERCSPILSSRLTAAAHRLAELLNRIYP